MSIKCLINIQHNGIKYNTGEIIKDITKKDAENLISNQYAIKINDKFRKNNADFKKVLARKYKKNKNSELETYYGF